MLYNAIMLYNAMVTPTSLTLLYTLVLFRSFPGLHLVQAGFGLGDIQYGPHVGISPTYLEFQFVSPSTRLELALELGKKRDF